MPLLDPLPFACLAAGLFAAVLLGLALRPEAPVAAPRLTLALLVLVSLAAAAVLVRPSPLGLRVRIDPSTEPLLPRGDPARQGYEQAVRHFGNDEVFVVAMETEDVFTAGNLAALRRVSEAIRRLPGVKGATSLIDVYSFRYDPAQDWVEVRPFIEEIPEDRAELAELRARALADPVYRRTLVSEDGRAAALNVSFRAMSDAEFIGQDLDGRIAAILAAESGAGRRFHVAGRPHVKTRVFHVMVRDLAVLIPAALLAMAAVAWLAFGTRRGVVLPLGTALGSNLWTFGALAALDRPLTILTTLLGPTLVALGCVYGVHVYARWEEEIARDPDPRRAAAAAARHLRAPVLVAGVTTMIGFGALLLSDVPAVRELGALSVFGTAAITLISLAGLPALLALLPPPRPARAWNERLDALLDARLAALAGGAARHRVAVMALCAGAAVAAVAAIPRIEIDTDYLSFFSADDPVRRDFEAVNRLLAGAVPIYVSLHGDPGDFRDPELLGKLETLQARIDRVPGVSRSLSFLETLRVLNRAIERDDPAQERIPDSRAGVSELLFMVPKGELARFMNVDHSRANLVVRTGEVGSASVRELSDRLEEELAEAGLPVEGAVTGNAILLNRSADGIAEGQPRTVGVAALAIFVLIAAALGSGRLGAVAMLPNLLPVLLFFGLLGAGVAPLSLPTSLIGSVALGIAIDDTAHFLFRYRREREGGASPRDAVRETGRRVGRAIAVTSLMLCIGFGVVAFSGFATLREFGLLSAATMGLCVLADLVLLPAVLGRGR
jgi:predicted RND superfamily exporter protein